LKFDQNQHERTIIKSLDYILGTMAKNLVGHNQVLGYHYDTFPPIKIDKTTAVEHFESKGKKLLLPGIRESINI